MSAGLPSLAIALALLTAGCGGYASQADAFRRTLGQGRPEAALALVNEKLGVGSAKDLPSKFTADTPLLLLERATILQALGEYKLSSRDFQAADAKLEVLDFTSDSIGSISKYLFSDDATLYRAPPHEKLLVNTMSLLNFLAMGELGKAKVEARRFTVNKKFLETEGVKGAGLLSLGSYLAAFAFEMSGEEGAAIRHYGDAHAVGGVPTLNDAAGRLAGRSGERDPRLGEVLASAPKPTNDDYGEVLVIVQTGMAPYLVPERLPIGAAVVYATSPGPGARLSSRDRRRTNEFAAKGLLKWVNYPSLKRSTSGRGRVSVEVGGRPAPGGLALDIDGRVNEQHESMRGTVVAASITRMLTRAVAGEVANAATKKGTNSGLAGLLVGLAVEGAMTAADTPDTRSWVTLPSRFYLCRVRVPPGEHTVTIRHGGQSRIVPVKVAERGFAVVNVSDLR